MPAQRSFDYAIVRVVPRVERQEFINVGVVLSCHERRFLVARVELDEARLRAFAQDLDLDLVRRHLDALCRVAEGGPGAGAVGALPPRERWHWLVAPRSTIIQVSAAHSGLTDDPAREVEHLMDRMVRLRGPSLGGVGP